MFRKISAKKNHETWTVVCNFAYFLLNLSPLSEKLNLKQTDILLIYCNEETRR